MNTLYIVIAMSYDRWLDELSGHIIKICPNKDEATYCKFNYQNDYEFISVEEWEYYPKIKTYVFVKTISEENRQVDELDDVITKDLVPKLSDDKKVRGYSYRLDSPSIITVNELEFRLSVDAMREEVKIEVLVKDKFYDEIRCTLEEVVENIYSYIRVCSKVYKGVKRGKKQ